MNVLFRGAGFIAIDKPAGALVIPGRGEGNAPSLREQLEQELARKIWVVHRLDRETSGVLLFALEAQAHRSLSMAFEAGTIRKTYLALVAGRLEAPLELDYALAPARRGRMRTARKGQKAKPARTLVRPVQTFGGASLVEAEPLTGRQHQIRVHLAEAGFPLLVDAQYGRPPAEGLLRTPLHASRLVLPGGETIDSPLPADIADWIQRSR